jgi:hypothetical protein
LPETRGENDVYNFGNRFAVPAPKPAPKPVPKPVSDPVPTPPTKPVPSPPNIYDPGPSHAPNLQPGANVIKKIVRDLRIFALS